MQRYFIRCNCSLILEILLQTAERLNLIVSVLISHPANPIFESGGYHGWYSSSSFSSSSVARTTSRGYKSSQFSWEQTRISCMRSRRVTSRAIPRPSLIVVAEVIRNNRTDVTQLYSFWICVRFCLHIYAMVEVHGFNVTFTRLAHLTVICHLWILATLWESCACAYMLATYSFHTDYR
jgi:hypothetical protein